MSELGSDFKTSLSKIFNLTNEGTLGNSKGIENQQISSELLFKRSSRQPTGHIQGRTQGKGGGQIDLAAKSINHP